MCKSTLQGSPKELNLRIDIYDEVGIGGGASGIAGGLLHPYSPKGFPFSSLNTVDWSVDIVDLLFSIYVLCGVVVSNEIC